MVLRQSESALSAHSLGDVTCEDVNSWSREDAYVNFASTGLTNITSDLLSKVTGVVDTSFEDISFGPTCLLLVDEAVSVGFDLTGQVIGDVEPIPIVTILFGPLLKAGNIDAVAIVVGRTAVLSRATVDLAAVTPDGHTVLLTNDLLQLTTEETVVSTCGKLCPACDMVGAEVTEVAGTLSIPCGMVVVLVVVDIVVTSGLLPDATALVLASDGFIPIGDIAAWTNTLLPLITEDVFAST